MRSDKCGKWRRSEATRKRWGDVDGVDILYAIAAIISLLDE